eukprot:53013-Chlamydomonas_euryale.AAC.5
MAMDVKRPGSLSHLPRPRSLPPPPLLPTRRCRRYSAAGSIRAGRRAVAARADVPVQVSEPSMAWPVALGPRLTNRVRHRSSPEGAPRPSLRARQRRRTATDGRKGGGGASRRGTGRRARARRCRCLL